MVNFEGLQKWTTFQLKALFKFDTFWQNRTQPILDIFFFDFQNHFILIFGARSARENFEVPQADQPSISIEQIYRTDLSNRSIEQIYRAD